MSEEKSVVSDESGANTANLIYILYLAGIVVGITGLIGVIMAYVNRSEAADWLKTHYTYQIHTFWKGLLYTVVGLVLTVVLIGFLILLFAVVWYIIRCIKGMQAVGGKKPIENPTTWWI